MKLLSPTTLLAFSLCLLSSCGWVPETGPTNLENIHAAQKKQHYTTDEFRIIDITRQNIKTFNKPQIVTSSVHPPLDFNRTYHDSIRPYDKLTLQIVDTATEGSLTRGGPVSFGPIEVPVTGEILFPYAGKINVLNKEISEVQADLQKAYSTVFSSAEVSLNRIERQPLTANVIGLASKPGQFQIDRAGVNLADLVAMAGSTLEEPFLCSYLLHRNQKTYELSNQQLTQKPPLAQDKDLLEIRRRKDNSVTILGAVRGSGNHKLPNKGSRLSDFLGEGQGLDVNRADTTGIFVFRKNNQGAADIYRFDLSEPSGVLYASQFYVHGGDVIYVTEAKLAHWNRLIRNLLPLDTISRLQGMGTL